MILYHGSMVVVEKPDVVHSRKRLDFGQGFYATPLIDQAKSLCRRYIYSGLAAYISKYQLDEEVFRNIKVRVLQFEAYSEEWLDFVFSCRRGQDKSDYDIVMGGVANDKVFDTVELYFGGLIEKGKALKRLKYEKPNFQICIRSQEVLDRYLHFEEGRQV